VPRYVAPAYTLHHDPGDPWEGRTLTPAAYAERLLVSRAPFPDQRFDIRLCCAEGEAVTIAWLWRATHLGDLPGFPATGAPISMSGATVYLFDAADRLTGHWQGVDRRGVYQQLQRHAAARQPQPPAAERQS
jgi:predicted ester cyclase